MEHLDPRSISRTFGDKLEVLVSSTPAATLGLSGASKKGFAEGTDVKDAVSRAR